MSDPSPVRFGAFELDIRTCELRKHGIRLKLQEQPFHVLQALLERPGELVTREEIERRVWSDHTFVDFDQSLNRAINKVREALGDSPENPRYIETMARRGYRFIAPVEGAPGPVAQPAPQTSTAGRPWGKIAWVAAGVLTAAGAGFWLTRDRAPRLAPRVVPLTASAGWEWQPAFSPDGKHVAFTWNGERGENFDVYVKLVGNVTALRLTSDPANDGLPAWSPDGRQIAFYSARGGGGIYLVSPDGGPERKLVDLPTDSRPAWTADGKYLLVAKLHREWQPETGDGALFLTPVDGGVAPRQILAPPRGTWYKDPALAPDGRLLAFASCRGPTGAGSCTLQVADLPGGPLPSGKPRQIAQQLSYFIWGVAWAPDGASLIYAADGLAPRVHLWRANVRNGNAPERLELAGDGAYYPAVDFQTGRLAFSRRLRNANIWRLEAGGKPVPFLTASASRNMSPQYSPDGRRIAFASSRNAVNTAIWVANADGTGAAQITNIGSPYSGSPRWSPDSRWLAFDAARKDAVWDVWVVEASGGSLRQLTHGPDVNAVPSWSRDGTSIYFTSTRTGRFEIWRIPAGGGTAVQVTRNGGYTACESTDGKTLYYTLSGEGKEGLWAKVLPDGEEMQVLKEAVASRGFAVFSDGVYYLHQRGGNSHEIRFYELASRQTRSIGDTEGRTVHLGLAVSPDRKTFLFARYTDAGYDLMLIENFR